MHERRKDLRVNVENACIIHHSEIVGTLRNISAGGLSCMCLDQGDCREEAPTHANIYCNRLEVIVENICMKVLESKIIPGKFAEHLGVRNCRAQFLQLDDLQKEQLKTIIGESSR